MLFLNCNVDPNQLDFDHHSILGTVIRKGWRTVVLEILKIS